MSESKTPKLDQLDYDILIELQRDGRITYAELAEKLGVSAGTVRNRYNEMTANRTLWTRGICNPHHVGFNAPATILVSVSPPHLEDAAVKIAEFPEITWMAYLTGEYDLQLDVACRDNDHLIDFITQRLQKVPGVRQTRSLMQLRILKFQQPSLDLVRKIERP